MGDLSKIGAPQQRIELACTIVERHVALDLRVAVHQRRFIDRAHVRGLAPFQLVGDLGGTLDLTLGVGTGEFDLQGLFARHAEVVRHDSVDARGPQVCGIGHKDAAGSVVQQQDIVDLLFLCVTTIASLEGICQDDPVGHIGGEPVDRQRETSLLQGRTKAHAPGDLRTQARDAQQLSSLAVIRQGSIVEGHTTLEDGGGLGQIALLQGRCPETCARGTTQREIVGHPIASGQLTAQVATEVAVIFIAQGQVEKETLVGLHLQVGVNGTGCPVPAQGVVGAETREYLGAAGRNTGRIICQSYRGRRAVQHIHLSAGPTHIVRP